MKSKPKPKPPVDLPFLARARAKPVLQIVDMALEGLPSAHRLAVLAEIQAHCEDLYESLREEM